VTNRQQRPSVLHVIVRAGATNSQYNEHCLPVLAERRITVCSLFPADVTPPPNLRLFSGDGTKRGCARVLREALDAGPYDVVHVHAPASGVLTLAVYLRTWRSRRNLAFTVHNSWANFRRRNRLFLYLILALYPTVVVCGRAARDSMPWLVRRLFGAKLRAVPNGVDVARIDRVVAGQGAAGSAGSRVIVSVNRLIPLKDPGTVLEAFHHADKAGELVLVGDGPLRAELEQDIQRKRLASKVRLTGIVERDEVYRMLWHADAFMSASGGEGLPVAVLEAMACRCPVILSDIPPHREIAAAAPRIPLVPVGDAAAFAKALRELMALPPKERRRLGAAGRQCVTERFSVRAMNDAYGDIYRDVVARNGSVDDRTHDTDQPRQPEQRGVVGVHAADDTAETGLLTRMRHRLRLVVALTLLGALAGAAYSHFQQPEYHAATSLLVGDVIGGTADEETLKASASLAASYADLSRREPVLKPVAELGFADNWRVLQQQVHAQTGDKNPQLIQITSTAPSADEAERLAAAVADQVVALTKRQEGDFQAEFAERQLTRLETEITETQDRIEAVQAQLDALPASSDPTALETQLTTLRGALADLQDSYDTMLEQARPDAGNGEVTILEHAYVTPSPLRPDLLGMVAAGAGAGFVLAAGWIHLDTRRRSRLAHRAGDGRRTEITNGHDRGPDPLPTEAWAPYETTPFDSSPFAPARPEGKGRSL
jgi:glycosyltransferase involved in cell wall biosynthesis